MRFCCSIFGLGKGFELAWTVRSSVRLLPKLFFTPFPPRTKPNALPQRTGPGRHALRTRAHLRNFQNVISAAARIPHWQRVIAAVLGVGFGPGLDAVCVVEVRRAAFDTTFDIMGLDNRLAVEVRVSKLAGNALLFHELVPSARVFGVEDALLSRVVSSRAEASRGVIIDVLQHSCVLVLLRLLMSAKLTDVVIAFVIWIKLLSINRHGRCFLSRVRYVCISSREQYTAVIIDTRIFTRS